MTMTHDGQSIGSLPNEPKMDMKLGILILLNTAPSQKLVLAPSAIFRGNTVQRSDTDQKHPGHFHDKCHESIVGVLDFQIRYFSTDIFATEKMDYKVKI